MTVTLTLGLVAAFAWGVHDILIRYITQTVPILLSLFYVLLIGALVQLGLLFLRGSTGHWSSEILLLAMASGVAYLVAGLGLYIAMKRGPVSLAAPLVAAFPVLSIGLAQMTGSAILPEQFIAVAIVVIGVVVVGATTQGEDQTGQSFPAKGPTILAALMSAAGFAVTFHIGQIAADASDELSVTFIARLTGLALLSVAMLILRSRWVLVDARALVPLAVMGALDGIALVSVIAAGGRPNPEFASVTASTFGIFTILLAWRYFHETLNNRQILGCALAFGGIAFLSI